MLEPASPLPRRPAVPGPAEGCVDGLGASLRSGWGVPVFLPLLPVRGVLGGREKRAGVMRGLGRGDAPRQGKPLPETPAPPNRIIRELFACGGTSMLKACVPVLLALAVLPAHTATQESRYTFLFLGNKAGSVVTRTEPGGELVCNYEFNDRGRGPKTETRFRLGPGGIPVSEHVPGTDYWKVPVDEKFDLKGGKATWKNAAENGERTVSGPAFYLSLSGPPVEFELLV